MLLSASENQISTPKLNVFAGSTYLFRSRLSFYFSFGCSQTPPTPTFTTNTESNADTIHHRLLHLLAPAAVSKRCYTAQFPARWKVKQGLGSNLDGGPIYCSDSRRHNVNNNRSLIFAPRSEELTDCAECPRNLVLFTPENWIAKMGGKMIFLEYFQLQVWSSPPLINRLNGTIFIALRVLFLFIIHLDQDSLSSAATWVSVVGVLYFGCLSVFFTAGGKPHLNFNLWLLTFEKGE